MVLLRLGLRGVKYFGTSQILISRNLSRVKLRHVVLLRLGLQEVKIAQNVVIDGVHSYLSNGHRNL